MSFEQPARQYFIDHDRENAERQRRVERARTLDREPSFLAPEWSSYRAGQLVPFDTAVMLSTGINPVHLAARVAWLRKSAGEIKGRAGDAVRELIQRLNDTSTLPEDFPVELDASGRRHVRLNRFAEAVVTGFAWTLPAGFPGGDFSQKRQERPDESRDAATVKPSKKQRKRRLHWTVVLDRETEVWYQKHGYWLSAKEMEGRLLGLGDPRITRPIKKDSLRWQLDSGRWEEVTFTTFENQYTKAKEACSANT